MSSSFVRNADSYSHESFAQMEKQDCHNHIRQHLCSSSCHSVSSSHTSASGKSTAYATLAGGWQDKPMKHKSYISLQHHGGASRQPKQLEIQVLQMVHSHGGSWLDMPCVCIDMVLYLMQLRQNEHLLLSSDKWIQPSCCQACNRVCQHLL